MKNLVEDAQFSSRLVFYDENGNYKGEAVDAAPMERLVGRILGYGYALWYLTMPLCGVVHYLLIKYYIHRANPYMSRIYPKEWPAYRDNLSKTYTVMFWCWIIFLTLAIIFQ